MAKTIRHLSFVILVFMSFTSVGCATPQGMVRTPLDTWETKQFPSLGFSAEIPKQPSGSQYYLKLCDTRDDEDYLGARCVLLNLHPIWSGSLLVEPHYLLEISFSRMTEARFQKRRDATFTNAFYSLVSTNLSAGPFEKESWKYLRFRRDYKMENGLVLICDAKLLRMNLKEDADYQADTNAIHRILNSVKLEPIQSLNVSTNK
jgi:hypothetical protein